MMHTQSQSHHFSSQATALSMTQVGNEIPESPFSKFCNSALLALEEHEGAQVQGYPMKSPQLSASCIRPVLLSPTPQYLRAETSPEYILASILLRKLSTRLNVVSPMQAEDSNSVVLNLHSRPVSYTHLTLPTIYSV
eukprot:TRINITY_DN3003_c0_g1_i1.p1 TRINITY_DN3003_c0_g1~~TRINITY_DN3003_c0_g1_i1.p1  ORF type:complete len:137 (+),score=15.09 TRINITY_DN3003_c0_g1_i1:55-465(+)